MTADELEAFFLNHDDPWFETIQEADSEGEAERLACEALDEAEVDYEGTMLMRVIRKIREN